MLKKILLLAGITVSLTANAALVDNGIYTTDTESGLDWLDLTETRGISYFDMLSNIDSGGALSGWRYATILEVSSITQQLGLSDTIIHGTASSEDRAAITLLNSYFGDLLYGYDANDPARLSGSYGMVSGPTENIDCCGSQYWQPGAAISLDQATNEIFVEILGEGSYLQADGFNHIGSYLIRETSTVPLPASVWLFSTGLLALAGFIRKK